MLIGFVWVSCVWIFSCLVLLQFDWTWLMGLFWLAWVHVYGVLDLGSFRFVFFGFGVALVVYGWSCLIWIETGFRGVCLN